MSGFASTLKTALGLSDLHTFLLDSTGARSADDLHAVLSAFPSLASSLGVPTNHITNALAQRMSAAYSAALSVAAPPPPLPGMGAVAPETFALGSVAGVAAGDGSDGKRGHCANRRPVAELAGS